MSPPRFHPEARQDFDEGAARKFAYRVTEIIDLVTGFPEAGNSLAESIRAFPIHPFSHDLVYRIG